MPVTSRNVWRCSPAPIRTNRRASCSDLISTSSWQTVLSRPPRKEGFERLSFGSVDRPSDLLVASNGTPTKRPRGRFVLGYNRDRSQVMSFDPFNQRLNRRTLAKTTGGLAALAAFSGSLGARHTFAQDATTVTMWGNHPEWKDPMEALLAAFTTAHPEVTIEFSATPGSDYPAKLQTALSGGQPSDILGELEGSIITKSLAGGALPYADLTGKIDLSGLTDTARSQVTVNGVDYGCPLASYTVGLAYQCPIFADNG